VLFDVVVCFYDALRFNVQWQTTGNVHQQRRTTYTSFVRRTTPATGNVTMQTANTATFVTGGNDKKACAWNTNVRKTNYIVQCKLKRIPLIVTNTADCEYCHICDGR
jgi:hypothetical protein